MNRGLALLILCFATAAEGLFAGPLIISEFRLRGPNGANDEFIEIFNESGADLTIAATDGSSGYAVAAADGVIRFVIPNGTVIPNRGHYLGVNSVGYSLASYAGGNGVTATGDATYTTNIPDNTGIALFGTANPANFSLATRYDAVGSTAEANSLYREGAGYPVLVTLAAEMTMARKYRCLAVINTPTVPDATTGQFYSTAIAFSDSSGFESPIDTGSNADDFRLLATNALPLCTPTSNFDCERLGAPGPENLAAPILRGSSFSIELVDPNVAPDAPPNLSRDFTSDDRSTFGSWSIRRRITNNTGGNVTRLRLRVVHITTYPPSGEASDLRVLSSSAVFLPAPSGIVSAEGLTLEEPPAQPNGGAFGSTLSVNSVTLAAPFANGASIYVNILVGIEQTGHGHFRFAVEALP